MALPFTPAQLLADVPQTTQDPCQATRLAWLAFPELVYQFFKYAIKADGTGLTNAFKNLMLDPGDYKMSVVSTLDTGTSDSPWLYCNGDQKLGTDYPAVAAILGTGAGSIFGAASVGNFKLPDFRGKFALPVSASHALAATGGAETVTLTNAQAGSQAHTHVFGNDPTAGTGDDAYLLVGAATGITSQAAYGIHGDGGYDPTTLTSGDLVTAPNVAVTPTAHANLPPYLVGGYVYIKT